MGKCVAAMLRMKMRGATHTRHRYCFGRCECVADNPQRLIRCPAKGSGCVAEVVLKNGGR